MGHRHIRRLQESFTAIERCRKPVLCAVQGACFGGGVDMAVACDVRVCSSDASFCVKEVDLAIVADIGTLQRLPKIVGHGVATEMALTARVVGAEEARLLGLDAGHQDGHATRQGPLRRGGIGTRRADEFGAVDVERPGGGDGGEV